jgi:outer membrane protein TolC
MSDVAERIRVLRVQAEQARAKRAQAEHHRSAAEGMVAQARASLAAEFGVKDINEAQELLVTLESKVADEVACVERLLGVGAGDGG